MKYLITCIFFCFAVTFQLSSQKYLTQNGHISFYSEAPLEDIEAHNRQVNSVIDFSTGEMVFSVLIQSFRFEKALMQEHFNERFLFSDKFPRSTFQGEIVNYRDVDLNNNGIYNVKIKGKLTIKGVTNPVEAEGTLEVKGDKVIGKSVFTILVADYEIEVPAVVRENIAREIEIRVNMDYELFEN